MQSGHFLNVAFLLGGIVFPGTLLAQSNAAALPGQRSALNEQQKRGEGVFFQRCSLCHVAKARKKPLPSFGPSLSGLLRDEKMATQKEKVVRLIILNGGPNMPGFQYGLEPKEIDDLMAYVKTL